VPTTEAASKLNDTGITACSNEVSNGFHCSVKGYPGQDAQFGRDASANNRSDGHAGFSFTKISRNGASLSAKSNRWNCVQDNVTGLIWEVKTDDDGLHDKDWTYSWYEPDDTQNGGNPGVENGGNCGDTSACDTNAYVQEVNAAGWCGANDWRLPTPAELQSLVNYNLTDFVIDSNYFPNTQSRLYWTSSTVIASDGDGGAAAWYVSFYSGRIGNFGKDNAFPSVRLVRGG
jgi:hypothetical protein